MLVNEEPHASQADSQMLHPSGRDLFRYWEKLRAERAAPDRAELDLKPVRRHIGHLFLMERHRGTYRWRLSGTRICELYRGELTGRDALSGWDSFDRDTIGRFLAGVVENLQPCILRFRLLTSLSQTIGVEMIGLPVVSRGGNLIHIFGGVFPFRDIASLSYDRIASAELSGARTIWTEHLPGDKLVARVRDANEAGTHKPFRLITGGRDG